MKRYLLKPGMRGMFYVDTDDETYDSIGVVDYMTTHIDWAYYVPEDGILNVRLKNETVTYPVSKDDIVLVFYETPGIKHRVVIINNEQWKENIASIKEQRLKQALNNEIKDTKQAETEG